MKFERFLGLRREMLSRAADSEGVGENDPHRISSLALAYVGDAVFSLRIRERLLSVGVDKVRVLHALGARMVSAHLQAAALHEIQDRLTEQEADVVRRGRNAAIRVPRNVSVAEYRSSTGFEALLGYLYFGGEMNRLDELMEQAIRWMLQQLLAEEKGGFSP